MAKASMRSLAQIGRDFSKLLGPSECFVFKAPPPQVRECDPCDPYKSDVSGGVLVMASCVNYRK
jgi:hypothetical protein